MRNNKSHIKSIKEKSGIYIIQIEGDFDIHSTPNMCKAIEKGTMNNMPLAVLLDFKGVKHVDSAAFACLISLIKNKIKDANKIGVFNLKEEHTALIEILRVHEIINNFNSEEEAVKYYT